MIFSIDEDTRRGDWTRFSTARTTPSFVQTPTVVDPSYKPDLANGEHWSTKNNLHTLMASIAYSTERMVFEYAQTEDQTAEAHLGIIDPPARMC